MKFWDTSAVVSLLIEEPATAIARKLVDGDPGIVVWWGTRTECISAISRRRREGFFTAKSEREARDVLAAVASAWSEILPSEQLRLRAERLLSVHSLRAADALQLAAALVWSRGDTSAHVVVSMDERLRDAVGREGFEVLPP
ncbi:MAG TPA: PIN domain-containing protein [Candidatus Binatia bacterium]|nr:PIN domain-containing protein [Candidatus Binatia bacterium]